jgi:hypothetical protein
MNSVFQPKGVCSQIHTSTPERSPDPTVLSQSSSKTTEHVTMEINYCFLTLLHDNEARLSSIVAYLRKRNVVLSHCYNSANVTEPREPHTCNNINLTFLHITIGLNLKYDYFGPSFPVTQRKCVRMLKKNKWSLFHSCLNETYAMLLDIPWYRRRL